MFDSLVNFFKKNPKKSFQNYADTLLINEDGKLLVLMRCNSDDFCPSMWSLPGGKIEIGETPLQGAIRELSEETNIEIDSLEEFKVVTKKDCTINYFIGSVDSSSINIIVDADEHQAYEWIDVNDIYDKEFLLDLGLFLKESFNVPDKETPENLILDYSDGRDSISYQILNIDIISKGEQIKKSISVLNEAFDKGEIDDETFLNYKNKLNVIKSDFDSQFEIRGEGADTWRMKILKSDVGEELKIQYDEYLSNAIYYNDYLYNNEGLRIPFTNEQIQDALSNYPAIYKVNNDQLDDFDSTKKVLDGLPRKKFQQLLPVIEEYDNLYSEFEELLCNQFDAEQTDVITRTKLLKKAIKHTFSSVAVAEEVKNLLSFIKSNVSSSIDPLLEITLEKDGEEKKSTKQVFISELEEILTDVEPTDYLGITNMVIADLSKYTETDLNMQFFDINSDINIQTIHNKVKNKMERKKSDLIDLKKSFDEGKITDDEYLDIIKSKRYELVKVERGGKIFYQNRLIGTDKIEEELPEGESFADDKTGLEVKRYSDKSILITGNTYGNLDLLRKIKSEVGYGTWNKALNGWVYPFFVKDKVFATLAEKMDVSTYDDTIAQENAIALKNSLNPDTAITYEQATAMIEQVIAENGGIEYFIGEADKEVERQKQAAAVKEQEVEDTAKDESASTDEEKGKRGRKAVAVGTISDDGKRVKTADGWEYIKIKKKEKEIGIPPATPEKTEELIQNADESNRFAAGKEIFGKEEGEGNVSEKIEEKASVIKEAFVIDIITRSGEQAKALDYSHVLDTDIQLIPVEDILNKPKPNWCPDILERNFTGYNYGGSFVFDYVKLDGDKFLLALNGYGKASYGALNDQNKGNDKADYAIVSLTQLVGISEYYKNKAKAEIKAKAEAQDKKTFDNLATWDDDKIAKYSVFSYGRLSVAQQKKYSKEDWEGLSKEQKFAEVPNMKKPIYSKATVKRIKMLDDNRMLSSNFTMYKEFVDKNYSVPLRNFSTSDPAYKEYQEVRQYLQQKAKDMLIQREENNASYEKGVETSYGDSNTKDDILESHGVKVKTQNGKEMTPDQIDQIKTELDKVYESFGNRSSMSKNFGLKISHAAEKKMFARKALGIYYPSMRAIGVSDSPLEGKFGFTLAHEFAHFIDNYSGKKSGKYFASDDFYSTAGKIAIEFRDNMNKSSSSDYINRTCECFARALEQFHAMQGEEDAVKYKHIGTPYHEDDNHVSKDKFNTIVKPLIEQFLKENDELLKALNNNDIQKSADEPFEEDNSVEGVAEKNGTVDEESKLTAQQLKDWAKNTPLENLEAFIKQSDSEELRKIAHKELARREKEEHVKDKPIIKKSDNPFIL